MSDLKQFERKVVRNLECGYKTKKKAKKKLQQMLDLLDADPESLTERELIQAFGHPEEIAKSLMDNVPEKEIRTFKTGRIVKRICAAVFVAALLISAIYVFFSKETPVEYDDGITVDEIVTVD